MLAPLADVATNGAPHLHITLRCAAAAPRSVRERRDVTGPADHSTSLTLPAARQQAASLRHQASDAESALA